MLVVGDIMRTSVVCVRMDDPLGVLRMILDDRHIHHLLVLDEGRLAGVISDRDVLCALSPFIGNAQMERKQDELTLQRKAHQIMTRSPVSVGEGTTVEAAADLMLQHGISCLPVISAEGRVRGIVTWRDLMRHARYERKAG